MFIHYRVFHHFRCLSFSHTLNVFWIYFESGCVYIYISPTKNLVHSDIPLSLHLLLPHHLLLSTLNPKPLCSYVLLFLAVGYFKKTTNFARIFYQHYFTHLLIIFHICFYLSILSETVFWGLVCLEIYVIIASYLNDCIAICKNLGFKIFPSILWKSMIFPSHHCKKKKK